MTEAEGMRIEINARRHHAREALAKLVEHSGDYAFQPYNRMKVSLLELLVELDLDERRLFPSEEKT